MAKEPANQNLDGLFIAMLTSYPEIVTLRYRRRKRRLRLLFALNEALTDETYEAFHFRLKQTMAAFDFISGGKIRLPSVERHSILKFTYLEIELALETLSREQISLVVSFVSESFPESLVKDSSSDLSLDERQYQEEVIEYLLEDVRNVRLRKDLIGIRDNGRIAIYDYPAVR